MNNKKINKTWRQAISYGINYTYIIEKMQNGMVFRANGPLAPNFSYYHSTIQAATYNLTKAREIMVSMGFGNMDWTDQQWQFADFAVWNYTYPIGDDFREDLKILLEDNLDLIGVYVVDEKSSWAEYIYRAYRYRSLDELELYWIGRNPDYLSPYNMVTKYFSNKSTSNVAQYHNHDVEMWLEQVLKESNTLARQALYSNILHQIVEVDMPHAFGYHPYLNYVHSGDIRGVPYNALNKLYIYPMYRV
jgi:ABC-type transport system substrate-binding protein